MNVGDTWNESQESRDALTGRLVRRLTSQGRINQTPTYHTNSGFTAHDGRLAFVSVREGATWILSAEAATGRLKALWRAPGVGDRNYIHRGMSLRFDDVDGRGVCGNRVCMAPRSQTAVFAVERSLMAVDINTCQPRVLLHDCGPEWIFGAPCVSPDERHVVICLSSSHPEMRENWTLNPVRHFLDYPHTLRIIRVPLDGGGSVETLYEHPQPAQSAHCAFCPTDGNLLYFDLDLPPKYWRGSDGKTPRIWLLDIAARTVRPLKTQYPGPMQIHQAWLWDGSSIAYHGHASAGGEYFGVAAKDGRTLWERVFPQAQSYGHNTPDPVKQALIIDGMFTKDRLQWLYWDGRPDEAILEPICLHNTEWGTLPGQYTHPHPLTDRTGRWISFTAAQAGRTDIHVVDTWSPARA